MNGTTDTTTQAGCLRFGIFELDLDAGELRKNGRKVRLQEQPFRLLAALVEKQGEVITRDVLKDKLWPDDTYVDFDRSLNTAASKLRDALGDSASSPRFIETLPRRGYRFLAPVESIHSAAVAETSPRTDYADEPPAPPRRLPLLWGLAALAATALAIFWAIRFFERPAGSQVEAQGRVLKLVLDVPEDASDLRISPDGRRFLFLRRDGAETTLWVQALDREDPLRLAGPGNFWGPFWSADSESVAFFSALDLELKKVSAEGGAVSTVSVVPQGNLERSLMALTSLVYGAWSPDGRSILFPFCRLDEHTGGLFIVPVQGGKPEVLLEAVREGPILADLHFLPSKRNERKLLYAAGRGGPYGLQGEAEIFLRDLDSGRVDRIVRGRHPAYSPSGHILYESIDPPYGLWALPFSLQTHETVGAPFLVRDRAKSPTISADGRLLYQLGGDEWSTRLVWRDRQGARLGTIGQPQSTMMYPLLSPDESRVAVRSTDGGDSIWMHDVASSSKRQLFRGRGSALVWSKSGEAFVFSHGEGSDSRINIHRQSADGGNRERLHDCDGADWVSDWGNDGKTILFDHQSQDVWRLQAKADGSGFEASPLLTADFVEKAAKLSPDGSHMAFVSSETGGYEVYVSRFPELGRAVRVSTNGGTQPRWSRDGSELFYVESDTLMSARIQLGDKPVVTSVKPLFQDPGLSGSQHPHYDVSKDGQRFVVREYFREGNEPAPPVRTVLVENWYDEFDSGDRR